MLQAEFFNNYLRDPERPMPLEVTVSSSLLQSSPATPGEESTPGGGGAMGGGPVGAWGQTAQMMLFGRGKGEYSCVKCVTYYVKDSKKAYHYVQKWILLYDYK